MKPWVAFAVVAVTTACTHQRDALVRVVAETPGANCESGGVGLQQGRDTNGNGTLDDAEVTQTEFVCNGPSDIQCPDDVVTAQGIVSVTTDAQLSDLSGVTCIDGDLIISGVEADQIPPSQLTTVTGSIVIAGNANLTSLAGLANVTRAGRSYSIQANDSISDISALATLQHAGVISIASNRSLVDLAGIASTPELPSLHVVDNPSLVSLAGLENVTTIQELVIRGNSELSSTAALGSLRETAQIEISANPALAAIELPLLARNEFGFAITANAALTTISLPSLLTTNSLAVMSNGALSSFAAPAWILAGAIGIVADPSLKTIGAPALQVVTGDVEMWDCPQVTTVDMHTLETIGGNLGLQSMTQLPNLSGFSALKSTGGNLTIDKVDAIVDASGFGALKTVSGNLVLKNNVNLAGFTGFDALTSVGGNLVISSNPNVSPPDAQAFANSIAVAGTVTIN